MEFTGERVVPGKVEADLLNEHLSRYYFVQPLAANRSVLDVGCGTGYGSAILAETAEQVLALDISPEAVAFASKHYAAPRLEYLVSDCCRMPVRSERFDVVVCFEVIEHVASPEQLLEQICDVLKPNGVLIVSTPNRVFYTEERNEINPFHTREFDFAEFSHLLGRYFERVEIAFQNHVSSIFVGSDSASNDLWGRVERGQDPLSAVSNFFVAVCSKRHAGWHRFKSLIFLPANSNLLREKERRIRALESQVQGLDQKILKLQQEYDAQSQWCEELNRQMQERTEWAMRLNERIKELEARLADLQTQFQERSAWAERLSAEISEKDHRILTLQKEFEERTLWALQLNEQMERIRKSKLFRLGKGLGLVPRI